MQTQELSVGHGMLTAARAGAGRDIVMLHSLLTDRHAFDAVLDKLAEKHRVTLFNLPGYHGSKPPLVALMDAFVAAIEDGFDELKISRDAILIGNGFGGTLALAFAFLHPERVGKLVVCGAAANYPPEGRQALLDLAREVAADGVGAIAEAAARRTFSPSYLAAHPEAVAARKEVLKVIDSEAIQAICTILAKTNLTPELHRIGRPVLYVCGAEDQSAPPALNRAAAQKIPGARYVELPGCGHCPPLEQPQAFIDAISEFVGL
jgi:3-oxoadipate enol-lactonase